MQPFRFIHCGDLHLGAPFQYATGISRAVDRAVSEATYVAFDTIIDTAIDEHVHAVVIAGDIYNSEDHNLEAQVHIVRHLQLSLPAFSRVMITLHHINCNAMFCQAIHGTYKAHLSL